MTKDEFRDLTRGLWPPHWTDEDFDEAWEEFLELRRRKQLN